MTELNIKSRHLTLIATALLLVDALSACSTGRQFVGPAAGKLPPGAAPSVHRLSLVVADSGRQASLTTPLLPGFTFSGDLENIKERRLLRITRLEIFANWPNGWTHGRYEASGQIVIHQKSDRETRLETIESLDIWDIEFGEIRYFEDYYRGEEGSRKVDNRVARLRRLANILRETGRFPVWFNWIKAPGDTPDDSPYRPDADQAVKPFLFPETMAVAPAEIDPKRHNWAVGYFWDRSYTAKILPEELRELRDYGSFWRDYREAPALFLAFYNLDYFFNRPYLETTLVEAE